MRKKKRTKRRKKHNMRTYPHDKIRGRLLRKGWEIETIDGVMRVGDEDIPVQTEVYSHVGLGEKLTLENANVAQKAHERQLKETFVERATEFLEESGWTLKESGQWWRPNWTPEAEVKQKKRLDKLSTNVELGCYATLHKALRIQAKLDSAPEIEGLTESLEDLMLMSDASEFGA